MDRVRATEIIAAYGADAARWPADERPALEALAAEDAALRREIAQAAELDLLLSGWAAGGPACDATRALAAADLALARAEAEGRTARTRRFMPFALGGSVAAALVAAVLILPTESTPPDQAAAPVAQVQSPEAMQLAVATDDSEMWSMMFTPTPDEESFL